MYSRPGYMSGCRTYAMVTPPSSESENRSKNVPLCFSSNICSAKGLEIKPMTNPFCHSLLKCCCVSRRIRWNHSQNVKLRSGKASLQKSGQLKREKKKMYLFYIDSFQKIPLIKIGLLSNQASRYPQCTKIQIPQPKNCSFFFPLKNLLQTSGLIWILDAFWPSNLLSKLKLK